MSTERLHVPGGQGVDSAGDERGERDGRGDVAGLTQPAVLAVLHPVQHGDRGDRGEHEGEQQRGERVVGGGAEVAAGRAAC
jgi:hypothetical protein